MNAEAKLLMLTHAFESLELNRVELLTDYLNNASQQAILRLRAKEERHPAEPHGDAGRSHT